MNWIKMEYSIEKVKKINNSQSVQNCVSWHNLRAKIPMEAEARQR